jgi:hypothetical protein
VELTDLNEFDFDVPGGQLWVAVRVDGVDLNGRQKLNSVPFAVKARNTDHAAAFGGEAAADVLDRIVPIGAITAWHKNILPDQVIPVNWAEYNGQVVGDTESQYDGQTLPNLNGTVMVGGESFSGLFLRGGLESGNMQADATASNGLKFNSSSRNNGGQNGQSIRGDGYEWTPTTITESDAETRPAKLSVVWIIRIK